MTVSSQGIELIKGFEGLRLTAYPDGSSYSVGYGHNGVAAGTVITREQANSILADDLARLAARLDALALPALSQNQFDALASLAYNIGVSRLASSTVLRLLRDDTTPREELRQAWQAWRLAGGKVSQGLVSRRQKEYEFYCATAEASGTAGLRSLLPFLPLLILPALAVTALILAH